MSVRHFNWGIAAGGSDSGGGTVIPADAPFGPGEPIVGTLAAGDTTLTFTSSTKHLTIRNTHDSQSLEYSLDGGTTFQGLGPYGEIEEPVSLLNLVLRNAGPVGTTYEVVGITS